MSDLEENEWINQHVDITKYSFDAVMGQLIFCYQLNTLVKASLQDPQLYFQQPERKSSSESSKELFVSRML